MGENKHYQGSSTEKVQGNNVGIFSLVACIVFYVSLYGLGLWVSQYELGNIKGRAAELVQSLSSDSKKFRNGEIAEIQHKKYALRPVFWKPKSIFVSLLGKRIYFQQNIELIKKTIESEKVNLKDVNLQKIN